MKRSEAIKIIANQFAISGNHYCEDGRGIGDAEKLLKVIEQFMQPRECVYENKDRCSGCFGHYHKYEWEEE
jgi:hypothetical protein